MASKQELQVHQKRELEKKEETTVPVRIFLPTADIYETQDALTVMLEIPGVEKNKVEVSVEDGVPRGGWIFRNIRDCNPSIPSTTSATIRGASAFLARSTRAASRPSSTTACCPWYYQRSKTPSRERFK